MISPQTCPICRRELTPNAAIDSPVFPFCSTRCKQVDLARWLDGKYAVVDSLSIDRVAEEMEAQQSGSLDEYGDEEGI